MGGQLKTFTEVLIIETRTFHVAKTGRAQEEGGTGLKPALHSPPTRYSRSTLHGGLYTHIARSLRIVQECTGATNGMPQT